jgi:hypothetical protein
MHVAIKRAVTSRAEAQLCPDRGGTTEVSPFPRDKVLTTENWGYELLW